MSEKQWRVVADRDRGDSPKVQDAEPGDLLVHRSTHADALGVLIRIERPVPTTDEPQKPELVTLHLYRDMCVGGLFPSERELDRTLHEHVEALTIRRDRLPSPHPPTREQIADYSELRADLATMSRQERTPDHWAIGRNQRTARSALTAIDTLLALIQNGADREWPAADDGSDLTWRERNGDDRG